MCINGNLGSFNGGYIVCRRNITCPCMRSHMRNITQANPLVISRLFCPIVERHLCRTNNCCLNKNSGALFSRRPNCNGCLHKLILQGGYKYSTQCGSNSNNNDRMQQGKNQPDIMQMVQCCSCCTNKRNQILSDNRTESEFCSCSSCSCFIL